MALIRSRNRELFDRARTVMPGGVSSPVRAFGAVEGTPPFIRSASGAHFEDVERTRYLDFVQSWGPLILGHCHPEVLDAIGSAAQNGTSYGAPHQGELDLADRIRGLYPGADQVRFVSSGTEATMTAIRLARGITGRSHILKFSGCYHGHSDGLLVSAGSGAVTLGQPSSAGVPAEIAALTHVLPLGDLAAVEALMAGSTDRFAAVIIEPIPANNGLLLQTGEFLQGLAELCRRNGTLLIFDEVISGFRVAPGGAAERYGITPDLATFGKVIGGGLAVGALTGSTESMAHLAPEGPVYQAGTLSGNPLAMAAGNRTLEVMERDGGWDRLETLGAALEARMLPLIEGLEASFQRLGSVFWLGLGSSTAPRAAEQIPYAAKDLYRQLHAGLLARGIYLAPSAYEVGFLSTAHTTDDIEQLSVALAELLPQILP